MIAAEESQLDTTEQPLLAPGDVVGGRYVLSKVLGRGAAGTVWEAEHRLLTSRVAVKFLDTAAMLDPASAEILAQRFRFEAQISARLGASTKHFVAAHDAGMFRGVPYLVMELVRGDTVEARLHSGPMAITEVADMLDQIAEPIDGAHAAGIAHRDVKPGNIMVGPGTNGGPPVYKLGDFGTAKVFGEGLVGLTPPKQTSENTLVGSPAYMSPEYISGLPLTDGCIDVWALAVSAYEGLTGKLPFDGEVWTQVAVAIVSGEFPPPSSVVPGLSPKFDEVFTRAFARQPADRYLSARHFARAFRQTVTAVENASHTDLEPIVIPLEERSRLWMVGAVGFVAVAGLGIASLFIFGGEPAPTAGSTAVPVATEPTGTPLTAIATATAVADAPTAAAASAASAAASDTPAATDRPVATGHRSAASTSTSTNARAASTAVEPPPTGPRPRPTHDKSDVH